MKFKANIYIVACVLFWTISFLSCYEPEEGCLDNAASNYDVNADDACSDCCVLPKFNLTISYLNGDESYSLGVDTIVTSMSSLIIDEFHFILSGITLVDDTGDELPWEDTFDIYDNGTVAKTVENDFKYYSRTSFRGTLNGLKYGGGISRIKFNIGLAQEINFYNQDSLELNTGLNIAPDEIYNETTGYEYFSFDVRDLDGNEKELTRSNDYPLSEISIELTSFETRIGFDSELNIFLDFGLLFDGINIESFTEDEAAEKLLGNFSMAFGER